MDKLKVLFLDTTHPALPQLLEDAGFECEHFYSLNRDELLRKAGMYHGFVVRSKFLIDKELIDASHRLKFIGRVGAGMENIDTEYAFARGIRCFNAPEGNRDAVGEHALGMLLALNNKLLTADAQVRRGIWKREENRGVELNGKTVAIIGYGNMGSAFAQRLKGFNTKVIAYDKYKTGFGDAMVEEVTMEDVYGRADVVSLHVPLTDETDYLVDSGWISRFQKKIILINTSRGRVVNTSDLVEGMKDGKINGACLDVLEYEKHSFEEIYRKELPPAFDYLIKSERVVLSPHIAGWTHESNRKLAEITAAKIIGSFKQ